MSDGSGAAWQAARMVISSSANSAAARGVVEMGSEKWEVMPVWGALSADRLKFRQMKSRADARSARLLWGAQGLPQIRVSGRSMRRPEVSVEHVVRDVRADVDRHLIRGPEVDPGPYSCVDGRPDHVVLKREVASLTRGG
jgi:hypothetical protein